MLYLATRFAWFLFAAFVVGVVMGRLGQDGTGRRFWHPALACLAAIAVLAGAASWMQLVNGVAALWIDSALLFLPAYGLGCVAGALLGARAPAAPDADAARSTPPAG